jgi:hypothetical protein
MLLGRLRRCFCHALLVLIKQFVEPRTVYLDHILCKR